MRPTATGSSPTLVRLTLLLAVGVLGMAWSPPEHDLGLGFEILPGRPSQLVYQNLGPILFTLAGLLLVVRPKRAGIHEHRFSVSLSTGYNEVALDTCRSGLTWGFNLRTDVEP